MLLDAEGDIPSVGRDRGASNDARTLPAPYLGGSIFRNLPDARPRARFRHIQQIVRS